MWMTREEMMEVLAGGASDDAGAAAGGDRRIYSAELGCGPAGLDDDRRRGRGGPMKFSKREDIEAPIDVVFGAAADFAAFERGALRRGIEVARRDALTVPGPGMVWAVRAPVRGKIRDILVELTGYAPDTGLAALAESSGITATVTLDLVALSRNRTRLQVGLDLRAGTLSARLLLQSLQLAKSSLDRRFARRVADFAARYRERRQPAPRPDRRLSRGADRPGRPRGSSVPMVK